MWPNTQFPSDVVTFTEEILNGKLHFLCSVDQIRDHSIKYVEGGVGGEQGRAFEGTMKYFRYILMGHEIFFKIFNGPQNIFYILFP